MSPAGKSRSPLPDTLTAISIKTGLRVPDGSKAESVVTDKDGKETRALIHDFSGSDGIIQGVHNLDASIASFAKACFNYALDAKEDLWFSTKEQRFPKNTIIDLRIFSSRFEPILVFVVVNFLENILKSMIVFFGNRVFGREPKIFFCI